jgi:hypothetical protein
VERTSVHKHERADWRRHIKAIMDAYKPPYPVEVMVQRRKTFCGRTIHYSDHGRRWARIIVARDMCYELQVESFCHEYAHVLSHTHRQDKLDTELHDESWGGWYSKIYRVKMTTSEQILKEERRNHGAKKAKGGCQKEGRPCGGSH